MDIDKTSSEETSSNQPPSLENTECCISKTALPILTGSVFFIIGCFLTGILVVTLEKPLKHLTKNIVALRIIQVISTISSGIIFLGVGEVVFCCSSKKKKDLSKEELKREETEEESVISSKHSDSSSSSSVASSSFTGSFEEEGEVSSKIDSRRRTEETKRISPEEESILAKLASNIANEFNEITPLKTTATIDNTEEITEEFEGVTNFLKEKIINNRSINANHEIFYENLEKEYDDLKMPEEFDKIKTVKKNIEEQKTWLETEQTPFNKSAVNQSLRQFHDELANTYLRKTLQKTYIILFAILNIYKTNQTNQKINLAEIIKEHIEKYLKKSISMLQAATNYEKGTHVYFSHLKDDIPQLDAQLDAKFESDKSKILDLQKYFFEQIDLWAKFLEQRFEQ